MPRNSLITSGKRKTDELTPQERHWCTLRVQGYSQTQAYRVAYNKPRADGGTASSRGSEVANKPRVFAYCKALYREAKKSDLLSHAEYLAGLFSDADEARAAKNWTAVSSFQRLIGQAIASLSDNMTISDERMTDEQLIERLGLSNPELTEQLTRVIGGRKSFH